MAKTKADIEDGDLKTIMVENLEEEQTEETVAESKERAAKEVVVTSSTKKVRVRVTEDVDSIVACVPYKLVKGKEYLVPSDVAAILCHAEKAYRI